jgi:Carboxypeptidase regulatory-like domain
MNFRIAAVIALASVAAACGAARGPVIGGGDSKAVNVGGTISGIVRSADGGAPLAGRKVTAVSVESGQRIEATTAINGGYTIKVPLGHYRLEVELQPGEVVTEQPNEVHISTSDIDAGRNFGISGKR